MTTPIDDPDRARRLAILRRVEGDLAELFSYANGLPEPARAEARAYLREMFTRAAMTAPRAVRQRVAAPGLAKPAAAPARAPEKPKGPRCGRCGGSGQWKTWKASGPCFSCDGSGVARPRRAGSARYR